MSDSKFPANIDDSFTEGWYFGRYGKAANHHVMTATNSTVAVRREYERGVSEGFEFERRCAISPWLSCDGRHSCCI